ncbi:hypothetical protein GCM10017322_39670 [Paracoccus aerius]|nr:hypothetical protein GCM10017322_39670 [Paracoccus aerius]
MHRRADGAKAPLAKCLEETAGPARPPLLHVQIPESHTNRSEALQSGSDGSGLPLPAA